MRASHLFTLALVAVAASGCKDDKTSDSGAVVPVRDGTLNVATFSYACSGPGDEQCNADSDLAPAATDSSFPLVAAGAQFLVGTTRNAVSDAGTGALVASGAGTTFFATAPSADKTLVTAVKPGRGSILAFDGTTIVDLTNLEIGTFDHVKVLSASPQNDFKDGAITIGPGGFKAQANVQFAFKFRVIPVDASGATLAGALPITWTIADPNIVSFGSGANDNIAIFKSGASGATTVHVTVGDKSADVGITVGELKMRTFLFSIGLGAVVLAGCSSDTKPTMNWLSLTSGVTSTGTTSTSPSAGHLTFNQLISHDDADRANTSVEADLEYDGARGMKIDEGAADLVLVRPFFDDGDSFNAWNRLAGDLHIANSAPDVADFQLLPTETRRFVLVGKKVGHTDLSFTIDGTPGTVTVPVDIVAPTTH